MNLVADEGVDRQIVDQLRTQGHEVLYVAELEPGMQDELSDTPQRLKLI